MFDDSKDDFMPTKKFKTLKPVLQTNKKRVRLGELGQVSLVQLVR